MSSLSTSNYYGVAGGEDGVDTGFLVFAVFTLGALSSATRTILSCFASGDTGYEIRLANNALQTLAANGSGAAAIKGGYTYQASDLGKVELVCMAYDGANGLHAYRARAEVGTPATCTGYTPSVAALNVGRRPNGTGGGADIALHGLAAFRGTATIEQIQAYFDAFKSGRALPATLGAATCTHLVNVASDDAPATISATVGDDLARTGSPTGVSVSSPAWSW